MFWLKDNHYDDWNHPAEKLKYSSTILEFCHKEKMVRFLINYGLCSVYAMSYMYFRRSFQGVASLPDLVAVSDLEENP